MSDASTTRPEVTLSLSNQTTMFLSPFLRLLSPIVTDSLNKRKLKGVGVKTFSFLWYIYRFYIEPLRRGTFVEYQNPKLFFLDKKIDHRVFKK